MIAGALVWVAAGVGAFSGWLSWPVASLVAATGLLPSAFWMKEFRPRPDRRQYLVRSKVTWAVWALIAITTILRAVGLVSESLAVLTLSILFLVWFMYSLIVYVKLERSRGLRSDGEPPAA